MMIKAGCRNILAARSNQQFTNTQVLFDMKLNDLDQKGRHLIQKSTLE
jgi:hypothetical protein